MVNPLVIVAAASPDLGHSPSVALEAVEAVEAVVVNPSVIVAAASPVPGPS